MGERAYPFQRLHKRWNNHPKGERQAHLIQQPTLGPPIDNLLKKTHQKYLIASETQGQSDDVGRLSSILAIFAGGITDDPRRPKNRG